MPQGDKSSYTDKQKRQAAPHRSRLQISLHDGTRPKWVKPRSGIFRAFKFEGFLKRIELARIIAVASVLIATAPFNAHARDGIEVTGDILLIVMPATAVGMTIGHRDGQGALQFGESEALTLTVTYGLKNTVTAERPDGGSQAFPSGHASTCFCSAEFIRKRYGWKYGLPSYTVASLVAYSRVDAGKHYTRDVAAGAAIGIISSYVFTKPYKGWSVEPQVDANYYGFQLVKRW